MGGFINVCLAYLKISASFLTSCFFHSINLSAGQKELVYMPIFLVWFDAQQYGRCFNFKAEERESFTQVKENSLAGKNGLRLDQLVSIRYPSPTIVDTSCFHWRS